MEAKTTEAAVVAELAQSALRTVQIYEGKVPQRDNPAFAAIPNGVTLTSLRPIIEEFAHRPRRKEGTAVLQTLKSFIDHVNRHKDESSVIFADRLSATPKLVAVLDYHEKGAGSVPGVPRFGKHRSRYDFPLSDEWNAWVSAHGKEMGQEKFSEFLEDRIVDAMPEEVADQATKALGKLLGFHFASPSKLVELSRGLSLRVDSKLENRVDRGTGETTMVFTSEHQDEKGVPVKVPALFLIAIPVFKGDERYQMAVRLRYKVRAAQVFWTCELQRAQVVFDHAFDMATETVRLGADLPLFVGSPE